MQPASSVSVGVKQCPQQHFLAPIRAPMQIRPKNDDGQTNTSLDAKEQARIVIKLYRK